MIAELETHHTKTHHPQNHLIFENRGKVQYIYNSSKMLNNALKQFRTIINVYIQMCPWELR